MFVFPPCIVFKFRTIKICKYFIINRTRIFMKQGAEDSKLGFDIWAVAKELQKKDTSTVPQEKTLIILGEHGAGKTSFVRILKAESDSDVKPTCALDYNFIRKTAGRKEVVHTYELAGKNLRDILSSLMTPDNYRNLNFVLLVDLSSAADLVDNTVQWLNIIREETERFITTKLGVEEAEELRRNGIQKFQSHEDADKVKALPINTILIGNKYDVYEKYDSEVRKWISRALRYLAFINGASLLFSTSKMPTVAAQIRAIFQAVLFGENPANANLSQKDYLKPIYITVPNDSIGAMTLPHSGNMAMTEALKKHLSGLVPAKQDKKAEAFDFSKYREPRIDALVQQKQKELEKISRKAKGSSKEPGMESPVMTNRRK